MQDCENRHAEIVADADDQHAGQIDQIASDVGEPENLAQACRQSEDAQNQEEIRARHEDQLRDLPPVTRQLEAVVQADEIFLRGRGQAGPWQEDKH